MILQSIIVIGLAVLANTKNVNSNKPLHSLKRDLKNIEIFNKNLQNGWVDCSSRIETASSTKPTLKIENEMITITLKQNEFLCLENTGLNISKGNLVFRYKLSNDGIILVSDEAYTNDNGSTIEYTGNGFINGMKYFENENVHKFIWKNVGKDEITLSMLSIEYENQIGNSDGHYYIYGSKGNYYSEKSSTNEYVDENIVAKELPECTDNYSGCNGENPTKYCLNSKGDGMIYGINNDGQCTSIEKSKYVFSVNDGIATLVTSSTTDIVEDSLVIYQCSTIKNEEGQDVVSCVKTSGYIYVDSGYYAVPSDEHKLSSKITLNGLIDYCNYDYIGSMVKVNDQNYEVSLCINNHSILRLPGSSLDDKNYILIGGNTNNNYIINPTSPFYNMNTSNKNRSGIVVSTSYMNEKTPTMMYFNKFYSAMNYCYGENGELIGRKDYLCKYGSICEYFYCIDGICKRSENTCPAQNENSCIPSDVDGQRYCDDGYYVMTNEYGSYRLASSFESGYLYHCENENCTRMIDENIMYGFFKNSDKMTKSIYPFIKCINSQRYDYYEYMCTLASDPTSSECSNPGDLIKVTTDDGEIVKVCLSNSTGDSVPLASENISFKYTSRQVINPYNENGNVVIILDKDSVHTVKGYRNYFLINESSKEIYLNPNENGRLYYCESLNCYYYDERTIGYVLNAAYKYDSRVVPYIQCPANSNTCKTISINKTKCSSDDNDSDAAKAGELFKTTEDGKEIINICLDTSNGKGISLQIKNQYTFTRTNMNEDIYDSPSEYTYDYARVMVSTSTPDSIFGYKLNKYVMVYIQNYNILYNSGSTNYYYDDNYSSGSFYKYTLENNMVVEEHMLRNSNTCDNSSNIIEFELLCQYDEDYVNNINYYRISDDQ